MWPRIFNIIAGVWLLAAPAVLNYTEPASINDRIIAPLVISFAAIAISDVLRPMHRVNILLGIWLVIAPLILRYPDLVPIVNNIVVGIVVTLTALSKGAPVKTKMGGGWSVLWSSGEKNAPAVK